MVKINSSIRKTIKSFQICLLYIFFSIRLDFSKDETIANILLICPHPDDEILGLGGLIIKMLDRGSKIHIIYLTDGEGSNADPDLEEIKRQRILLSNNVCSKLGIFDSAILRLHIHDGAIPHASEAGFDEAVNLIKEIIDKIKPDAVFVTHPHDFWPFDHVASAQITKEAVLKSYIRPQLWFFWVWAWFNVRPWKLLRSKFHNLQKVDISDQLIRKRELINVYLDEVSTGHKPWSGILPKPLIKAFHFPIEIIEREF
jgi:LmbE family N-acetylglucosaminyl deacetylase